MLERIRTVRPVGVHHRHGGGELLLALMMVRYHHVHAQRGGVGHLLIAGDAAVHGDHQSGTLIPQAPDGLAAQAVAVLHPPGNIAQALDAAAFEIVHQQHRGGDAVHIVIAEHGDGLPIGDGPLNPGHSLVHVLHSHGGEGQGPFPVQRLRCSLRRVHAPGSQDYGEQIRVSRPPQEGDVLLIRSADVPLLKFHGPVLLSGHKCVYNAIITTLL